MPLWGCPQVFPRRLTSLVQACWESGSEELATHGNEGLAGSGGGDTWVPGLAVLLVWLMARQCRARAGALACQA